MRTLVTTLLAATFLIAPLMAAKPRKQRVPRGNGVKIHKAKKQHRRARNA